ncbi:MAG TPA: helix-turn-helix transcriptional regulator [Actinomycetota bacterium]|nr:helix-turn-helix transcriptional regulator [Actinomycetota bacterium]
MARQGTIAGEQVDVQVHPVVVVSRTFPARPASIPDIRRFVQDMVGESPLSEEGARSLVEAVSHALLEAAGPGGTLQISFRVFPDSVEVDVLRSTVRGFAESLPIRWPEETSFATWMGELLRREGLTQEAAARQLGVSVRTIGRWVRGDTKPRMRELRRILEVFGQVPPT